MVFERWAGGWVAKVKDGGAEKLVVTGERDIAKAIAYVLARKHHRNFLILSPIYGV